MEKYVIITAGGKGERMQADVPKQFLELQGKPILFHTIERFYDFDNSIKIIVCLPESHHVYWKKLCKEYHFSISHTLTFGGKTRFHSVQNSLQEVPDDVLVGIHDGVRPFINNQLIQDAYQTAEKMGTAVPAITVKESLRVIENEDSKHFDREKVRIIQTPQCFRSQILKKAYQQPYRAEFTDDASVVEADGVRIVLFEGSPSNIKITLPIDLQFAEILVKQ